jgi:hypothetical protein
MHIDKMPFYALSTMIGQYRIAYLKCTDHIEWFYTVSTEHIDQFYVFSTTEVGYLPNRIGNSMWSVPFR